MLPHILHFACTHALVATSHPDPESSSSKAGILHLRNRLSADLLMRLVNAKQDALTAEERQLGKRVNFSIVYGAGTRQLASDLGMTQRQAQDFLDK